MPPHEMRTRGYESVSYRLQKTFEERETGRPVAETAARIDVADCARLREGTAPVGRATPRIWNRPERIIAAGDDHTGKAKPVGRNRLKPLCGRRKQGSCRIGDCYQKGSAHGNLGALRPVDDQQTAHAMGDQDRRCGETGHGGIKALQPFLTDRTIPITLPHPLPTEMPLLPQGLPMIRSGIADARNH